MAGATVAFVDLAVERELARRSMTCGPERKIRSPHTQATHPPQQNVCAVRSGGVAPRARIMHERGMKLADAPGMRRLSRFPPFSRISSEQTFVTAVCASKPTSKLVDLFTKLQTFARCALAAVAVFRARTDGSPS